MSTGKDIKPKNRPVRDTKTSSTFKYNYADRLVLPQGLKERIASEGLVYRFLNAAEMRASGGYHRSHWTPYRIKDAAEAAKYGASPEGTFTRGDLVLGVRTKEVNEAHKEFLAERNRAYKGFNKQKAEEMRQDIRRAGLGDYVQVDDKDEDESDDHKD